MKKLLPILIGLLSSCSFQAQIVFCPPGAEWRYNFIHYRGYALTNESIIYTGKTVVAGDTVKVLKHRYSFNYTNDAESDYIHTLIKQKGDTIFFQNKYTQDTWQILYNFNVLPGDSWNTKIGTVSYQISVDSVKLITLNSIPLKQLTVRYPGFAKAIKITERFGCSDFMFNYVTYEVSDGGTLQHFICYQDSSFGNIQFTTRPCDFVDYVGLNEEIVKDLDIKAYSNPSNGILNINFSEEGKIKLVISNALGQEVFVEKSLETKQELDISHLSPGVYFLTLRKANRQKTLRIVMASRN